MNFLQALNSWHHREKNDYCRYCNNVIEAFQCSVTYTIKWTSAFAMIHCVWSQPNIAAIVTLKYSCVLISPTHQFALYFSELF